LDKIHHIAFVQKIEALGLCYLFALMNGFASQDGVAPAA
jgi:hypothetical protein